jgi:hypothetical protein
VSAEEALRRRVRRLIEAFNGPFGRMVAGLIAEGQSELAILQEYDELLVTPRRAANLADLERGKAAGELRADTDTK